MRSTARRPRHPVVPRRRDHGPAAAVEATREPSFLLAKPEKRLLQAIARRLPRWGAARTTSPPSASSRRSGSRSPTRCRTRAASGSGPRAASSSSTGSATRSTARSPACAGSAGPRYGYYLDHLVDGIATAMIGIGLGLSPHMLLSVGTLLVVAYLVLSINVYLESQALGRFSIGYGLLGPTEARIGLIALNTALALGLELRMDVLGLGITALDVAGVALAGGMLALLAVRARRNLRELARAEPSASRRGPQVV